jgi:hypothetical protein
VQNAPSRLANQRDRIRAANARRPRNGTFSEMAIPVPLCLEPLRARARARLTGVGWLTFSAVSFDHVTLTRTAAALAEKLLPHSAMGALR